MRNLDVWHPISVVILTPKIVYLCAADQAGAYLFVIEAEPDIALRARTHWNEILPATHWTPDLVRLGIESDKLE